MQLVQEIPPKMAEQTNTGMVLRESYWHSIIVYIPSSTIGEHHVFYFFSSPYEVAMGRW